MFGERLDGPGLLGLLMDEAERLADLRIDQRAQPAGRTIAGLREMGAHGVHEQDVGEPAHHGRGAGLAGRHLGRDEMQRRFEPLDRRPTIAADVNDRRQRSNQRIARRVVDPETAADDRRRGAAAAVLEDAAWLAALVTRRTT